jgi:hypothetical protein
MTREICDDAQVGGGNDLSVDLRNEQVAARLMQDLVEHGMRTLIVRRAFVTTKHA